MVTADALEQYMLELINAERVALGLDPLQLEVNLNAAAEDHSEWMLQADIFSHTGAGNSTMTQRMTAADFDFSGSWSSAENIAIQSVRGDPGYYDDVEDLHIALMNSTGHRANLLNPNLDYIGIGIELGEFDFSSGTYASIVVTQNFAATQGTVDLDAGPGAQVPYVSSGPSTGNDVLFGTSGADQIVAQQGDDRVMADDGDDRIVGGGGEDELYGGAGRDKITSGAGDDFIDGGEDRDILRGGAGDDVIIGDHGNDVLFGGGGADTFIFNDGDDKDRIAGFEQGVDTIELDATLSAIIEANASDISAIAKINASGNVITITFNAEDELRLVNNDGLDLSTLLDDFALTL